MRRHALTLNQFLCAHKCSAPYYKEYGYQYHDIAVSVFTAGGDAPVQTVMYVNDRKYNSSPDVTLHEGEIVVVHNKSEHLYGDRDNPAAFCGDFMGRIGWERGSDGEVRERQVNSWTRKREFRGRDR